MRAVAAARGTGIGAEIKEDKNLRLLSRRLSAVSRKSLLGEIQAASPGWLKLRTERLTNPAPTHHHLESDLFSLRPTYNFSPFTPRKATHS